MIAQRLSIVSRPHASAADEIMGFQRLFTVDRALPTTHPDYLQARPRRAITDSFQVRDHGIRSRFLTAVPLFLRGDHRHLMLGKRAVERLADGLLNVRQESPLV